MRLRCVAGAEHGLSVGHNGGTNPGSVQCPQDRLDQMARAAGGHRCRAGTGVRRWHVSRGKGLRFSAPEPSWASATLYFLPWALTTASSQRKIRPAGTKHSRKRKGVDRAGEWGYHLDTLFDNRRGGSSRDRQRETVLQGRHQPVIAGGPMLDRPQG